MRSEYGEGDMARRYRAEISRGDLTKKQEVHTDKRQSGEKTTGGCSR
jgi:hypothetical protein